MNCLMCFYQPTHNPIQCHHYVAEESVSIYGFMIFYEHVCNVHILAP